MNDWGFEKELEWVAPPPPDIPVCHYANLPAGLLGHRELGIIIQKRIIHRHMCESGTVYYSSGYREHMLGRYLGNSDQYREGIYVNGEWFPPDWD